MKKYENTLRPTKSQKVQKINHALKICCFDYEVNDHLKADEINILYNTIHGIAWWFWMNWEKRVFALKSWIDALMSSDYCYYLHKVGDKNA